ncbi:MAG: UTP--glucose-1-phosphate uridylyltransferase [Candidatus Nomurabacteria bacterium]|jgi:UTP--glucose-1-phosphate uridylyltransferase|nr:UTP--glucose-1-phosphate uridylyltransferase [Candidatus Nomurabacteria bacterium]
MMSKLGLKQAQDKMRIEGINQIAIDVFTKNYKTLESGKSSFIDENDIEPLENVTKMSEIKVTDEECREALKKTAVIKLNGGLGTSMGLNKVKTAIEVRNGENFLDIIVKQIFHARKNSDATLPLIFMNSFRTRDDTLNYIKQKYPEIIVDDLPLDFIQNMEPRLRADDLTPVAWLENSSLEWCPPGHGDLYPALYGNGLLDQLLKKGYEYLFVSNGDNLGATLDAKLACHFAKTQAPFMMEVCRRTVQDKKGGHLAVRKSDKRTILRELAQTTEADAPAFQDIKRHHYFNTNTIWLNLPALQKILKKNGGVLGLPLIQNQKTIDPAKPDSPEIIQMESAMGAAIEIFESAIAIEVPRVRFMPVKTTNDLLMLRSDLFKIDKNYSIKAQVENLPKINLDNQFYKLIADFDKRFAVVPSLIKVQSLTIEGDHFFAEMIELIGEVKLKK